MENNKIEENKLVIALSTVFWYKYSIVRHFFVEKKLPIKVHLNMSRAENAFSYFICLKHVLQCTWHASISILIAAWKIKRQLMRINTTGSSPPPINKDVSVG